MNVNEFDLEKLYQAYLKDAKLSEAQMHPIQRQETKRAYMAACASMLFVFRDGLGALDEDEAVEKMQSMMNQVVEFWNNQTNANLSMN